MKRLFNTRYSIALVSFSLIGCSSTTISIGSQYEPETSMYSPPESSGLISIRPYPGIDDVWQIIGKNSATKDLITNKTTLIGCPSHENGAIKNRVKENAKIVAHTNNWTLLQIPLASGSSINEDTHTENVNKWRQLLTDTTLISWDNVHGTQLEYHNGDGGTWLVYPGNSQVLQGEWLISNQSGKPSICYRYYTNGKNPSTGIAGIDWECVPSPLAHRHSHLEYYDGDIFKLYQRVGFPDSPSLLQQMSLEELSLLFSISVQSKSKKPLWHSTQHKSLPDLLHLLTLHLQLSNSYLPRLVL